MHASQMEDLEHYAGIANGFDPFAAEHPVDKLASYADQERLRGKMEPSPTRPRPYEIHHLAEKRVQKALGLPATDYSKSPGLALPGRPGVDGFNVAEYEETWKHAPIYHQGPQRIKTEIDAIFTRHNIPDNTEVPDAVKRALLDDLKKVYTKPPYDKANMWPATRDWLLRRLDAAGKSTAVVPP